MRDMDRERTSVEKEVINATNNFWIKLPDDNHSPIDGEPKIRSGYLREIVNRHGKMDSLMGSEVDDSWKPLHSDLFLEQTYREFFLVIDDLVEEFGLKDRLQMIFDKIDDPLWNKKIVDSYSIALGDERISLEIRLEVLKLRQCLYAPFFPLRDEAVGLCLPIYRRLLEMGYTKRDLTA